MMRAVDLFKRYREAINPPYSSKDLLPILGTLFILFALPVIVLSLNSQRSLQSSADRKLLPANLQVYHGNANEPAIPGNVTWITGCGFTPGVKIQLVDSVTYKA